MTQIPAAEAQIRHIHVMVEYSANRPSCSSGASMSKKTERVSKTQSLSRLAKEGSIAPEPKAKKNRALKEQIEPLPSAVFEEGGT